MLVAAPSHSLSIPPAPLIIAADHYDVMSSDIKPSIIVVSVAIASSICLALLLTCIVQKWRRKKKMTRAVETPMSSAILTRNADVELQSERNMEPAATHIGEAYTIEGHKVRLAYHQELPQRILNAQSGRATILSSGAPAPTNGPSSNMQTASDPRAVPSPPAQNQPVALRPDETTAAILALQQEVQRLRTQNSQPMILPSQDEDPFNPLPVVRQNINTPLESTPQERALRSQLDVLRAEVERLQAENAVLVLADPSSPPAYQPE